MFLTNRLICSVALFSVFVWPQFGCNRESTAPPEPLSEMEEYGLELGEKISCADISILFIGNSHTAYNRIARQVETLLEGELPNKNIFCQERAVLGKGLDFHRGNEQTNVEFKAGQWDYIVLQGHPIAVDGSSKATVFFTDSAKQQNSKVIHYSVWGRKNQRPTSQEKYEMLLYLAKTDGNVVVPVGLAWDRVQKERPDLELFLPDNNHASAHGGYLTALVFANYFTQKRVETRLSTKHFESVSAETADYFAQVASDVVKQMQSGQ